jgi:GTP cyclohydrolase I
MMRRKETKNWIIYDAMLRREDVECTSGGRMTVSMVVTNNGHQEKNKQTYNFHLHRKSTKRTMILIRVEIYLVVCSVARHHMLPLCGEHKTKIARELM